MGEEGREEGLGDMLRPLGGDKGTNIAAGDEPSAPVHTNVWAGHRQLDSLPCPGVDQRASHFAQSQWWMLLTQVHATSGPDLAQKSSSKMHNL
eukprot:675893-Pelagomonas_calceolata.AAC.2